ncbi:TLC domain [Carpediemonas membranifera]|uniref:TLC domain n=1 Tax=Carpediemonas membranifera TaxID=201153 RepID=A0A8J6BE34_9EUKA|nr:TLC domain [Carpediemonas membranifera]|eukprot:KAG9395562.1 TLC domain [Carpediemonas membranifera]
MEQFERYYAVVSEWSQKSETKLLSFPQIEHAWALFKPHFYTQPSDFRSVAIVLSVFVPVFLIYRSLTKAFGFRLGKLFGLKLKDAAKFSESLLFFVTYTSFFIISTTTAIHDGYMFNPVEVYTDNTNISFWAYFVMYAELSHYITSLILMFSDVRNKHKDIPIMLTHHIITLSLMTMAFVGKGQYKLFLQTIAFHDFTDIFLEGSKLVHYVVGDPLSGIPFVMFAASFAYTRIYMLPKHIFLPITQYGNALNDGDMFLHKAFVGFFWGLYTLHLAWMWMIIRMCWGIVKGTVRGDIRSDGEGERVKGKKEGKKA